MEVIDVTVVGGPDVAAVVERVALAGATVLRTVLANDSPAPARPGRVGVLVETAKVKRVEAPGVRPEDPGHDGPPTGDVVGSPWVLTDRGVVGWLGTTRHHGEVRVKADGWLIVAWADLEGVILWPGERMALDDLWVGGSSDPAAYAGAWAALGPPLRPVAAGLATVVAPGAAPPERGITVAADLDDVARLRRRAPGPVGAVVDPWPRDADLTRPGVDEGLAATGARLAGAGVDWVLVRGCRPATAPRPRWGEASTTPIASLRAGLAALRRGLGPDVWLHLGDGPPGVAGGIADVVDTGPGWPSADPLTGPTTRAAMSGTVWHACGGPLRPGTPPELLEALRALTALELRSP